MANPNDIECLANLENLQNKPIVAPVIYEQIRNYGKFYHDHHGVPNEAIFYAAAVSGSKLRELCDNPRVKIFLAKTSPDPNNISDFKFIIMGADIDGETLLDDPDKDLPNKNYMDDNCCKNPPPDASGVGLS